MSISPLPPYREHLGNAGERSGSSTPSRTMRNWPPCSVISMSPLGRKASDQGRFRPFMGTTRNVCSWVWNTCGSHDIVSAGGQSPQSLRRSGSWAAPARRAPAAMATTAAAAASIPNGMDPFNIGIS